MHTVSKSRSWQMFDHISPRYDFLNHLLSFGLDIRWRTLMARSLPDRPQLRILDLATGTGDVLLSFVRENPTILSACGMDMSKNMLAIARKKIENKGLDNLIELKEGDAADIPLKPDSFDVVSIAFGIRNMETPGKVLMEMCRVLKRSGRVLVLEFSLPANPAIRLMHLFYLRHIVPLIGGLFSGHVEAYKYLNRTVEDFPYGREFCQIMQDSGFINVKAKPLFFGVATLYQGEKA